MYSSPTPCQIWGGCGICIQYVPYPSSLCCALQTQPDLWQKLRLENLIKRNISAQARQRQGEYTHTRSALSCLCSAWGCSSAQAGDTRLSPPHAEGSGCQGTPGQSWHLAWTYILPPAGTGQRGIFIVNTAVLLWSMSKRQKQEEDQKSCALLWKFLHGSISSPTGA